MMKRGPYWRFVSTALMAASTFHPNVTPAAIPLKINYQGVVSVSGTPFEGTGYFKFALMNDQGASVWSNDGASVDGSEPAAAVSLNVSDGVYSVALGDDGLANMAALTGDVFNQDGLTLRLWFNDGENGFAPLTPDTPIHSVSFAIRAASADSIPDQLIEEKHLSDNLLDRFTALEAAVGQLNLVGIDHLPVVSTSSSDATLTGLGYQKAGTLPAPAWVSPSTSSQPMTRVDHGMVWTGEQILVWGGIHSGTRNLNSGSAYNPSSDTWSALPSVDAPTARHRHTCVWTGAEMIVWGGIGTGGYLNTGGRYQPSTQQWSAMTKVDAPVGRQGHASVWTGDKLLIWGGRNAFGHLNDGGLYDPVQNEWTLLSAGDPPSARYDAGAVWAGDRLFIFGGIDMTGVLNDGAQLVFEGGSPSTWMPMNAAGSPSARSGASLVWTGSRAIVFGGRFNGQFLSGGGVYDPVADAWIPLSSEGAPSGRHGHVGLWSGEEMLILTGETTSGETATAYAYHVGRDLWRELSGDGNPLPRSSAGGIWTGEMAYLFGGLSSGVGVASLQGIEPKQTLYLYRKP